MKIETAEIRLANAVFLYQEDRIDRSEYDRRVMNILRGIWLELGVDAVNEFTNRTMLSVGSYTNVFGTPVVKKDLTDEILAELPPSR